MLFEDFDFSLLDDPSFKEDSVREELIAPLLKALGYSASPPNRIRRSVSLTHPYVYLGSKPNKIYIIPDYLLEKDGKKFFVLDAKAPNEDIFQGKNVEQAYSYAMHPEIRVDYYALCNGHSFALYDVREKEPLITFSMSQISNHMTYMARLIGTSASTLRLDYKRDWGLYLVEMGWDLNQHGIKYSHNYLRLDFDHVAKVVGVDGLYTFQCVIKNEDMAFLAAFDFDASLLCDFLENLSPPDLALVILFYLERPPYRWHANGEITGSVAATAEVGDGEISNNNERYFPLVVKKFLPALQD